MKRVIIFDTTLRDGEQSPGASLNTEEKVEIAKQLQRLRVDVMEAGFPVSSPGDFESVQQVAHHVKNVEVCGLARANRKDIDVCWEALKKASHPRIHTFIGTSDIHIFKKLQKTREEVFQMAVEAVKHAKKYTSNVEFSPEDAVRTDFDFLCRVVEAAIKAGATTINIPDTVGYAIPGEFGEMVKRLMQRVPNMSRAVLSVHCHNDLGLGVSNSLAAILNGARQVECTINGLGERAGNAALEEVVMAIRTRKNFFHLTTGINTREIYKTSKLVSNLTGISVQANKAVVGANAFAHEAGIHQDGIIKERTTYEIMTPSSIGLNSSRLVMGKHSGRRALRKKLEDMGFSLTQKELDVTFERFKGLADKKKEIFDSDIIAIVEDEKISKIPEIYKLKYLNVTTGNQTIPTATVRLEIRKKAGNAVAQEAACGDGPVDAAYKAVDRITGINCRLIHYSLNSVSRGKDALGEVTIKGSWKKGLYMGRGSSTDIIEASVKAYLNVINKIASEKDRK